MRLIKKMLKQKAVYWENTGIPDPFGRPTYKAPVLIRCRWEEISEVITDAAGAQMTTRARAYTEIDIVFQSALMLAPKGFALASLPNPTDPYNNAAIGQTWEVRRFDKFPTRKATHFLRTAFM